MAGYGILNTFEANIPVDYIANCSILYIFSPLYQNNLFIKNTPIYVVILSMKLWVKYFLCDSSETKMLNENQNKYTNYTECVVYFNHQFIIKLFSADCQTSRSLSNADSQSLSSGRPIAEAATSTSSGICLLVDGISPSSDTVNVEDISCVSSCVSVKVKTDVDVLFLFNFFLEGLTH